MAHIIHQFQRPPEELIEQFKGIGAATVYEAGGRIGSVSPAIKPLAPGMKLLGPALTVRCFPRDNLMLHKAMQMAKPNDIIVAITEGFHEAGYFGELMATSAKARQLGGLAIDACVRDSADIIAMNFSVFSRGTCIRGTTKKNLGLINQPIVFGEVVVHPGDLVIGDDDGMVILPKDSIKPVLDASSKRIEIEKQKTEVFSQGMTSVELYKLDEVFISLGAVVEE